LVHLSKCSPAPATDFGVDVHGVPVLGAMPADFIFGELIPDIRGAGGVGEVDQIYMLMPRPDVLQLHPSRTMELHRIIDIVPLLPHQLDPEARLLEDLAQSGFIREFVSLYMSLNPHTL